MRYYKFSNIIFPRFDAERGFYNDDS
jgi:hypothetical protein